MYGNLALPGYSVGDGYKVPKGSIWRGYPEATWFRIVPVAGDGDEAVSIPIGTIMKEGTDGKWSAISISDIISVSANLPGPRLGVVADETAKGSYSYIPSDASAAVSVENTALVGIMGQVDQSKLLVGETAWDDLTDAQKIQLRTQLGAWNISPVWVMQA